MIAVLRNSPSTGPKLSNSLSFSWSNPLNQTSENSSGRSTSLSIARTPRMWSWSTCLITKTSMGRAPRLLRTRPRVDERLRLCLTSKRG